jgi:hypothetical protein
MSSQLNDLMRSYVAAFDDYPTIVGMTDDSAVRAINKAIKDGKPIAEPTDPAGEVEIFV